MKNQIITINREDADALAAEYFLGICGFNRNKAKFEAMIKQGMDVREKIADKVQIKAIVSSFEKGVVQGRTITINGLEFECNALEQINGSSVRGIYAYILTVGSFCLVNTTVLEMFYSDAWGTAYVDAGRDMLRWMLGEYASNSTHEDIFISDSFGPGYYGMDLSEVKKFFRILDAEKIGVRLNEGGLMIPVKSCTGFYLAVNNKDQLPKSDCKSCLGNEKGCQFCRAKAGKL